MDAETDLATRRRDEFRELGAATIVTVLAMTAYALSAPIRIEERTQLYSSAGSEFDWGLLLVAFGAFAGTLLTWTVFVERRWPWPIGERRPSPPYSAWAIVPQPAAWVIAQVISSSWPHASGLYFRGQDQPWLEVSTPVDLARALVLFALCWSIASAAGNLIDFVVRRRRVRSSSVRVPRPAA